MVTTIMEHHANFLPWQKLCEESKCELRVAIIDSEGNLDLDHLKSLVDEKTRMISVVHISNTLGTINPVEEIIGLARQKEIPIMLDAAQSAAYYDLDAQKYDYDFLAFSGHKIFGPFGVGILYASDRYRNEIDNYNVGGGMIEHVSVEKTRYRSFPYNLEAGTSNISAVIGLGAAVDFINESDREKNREHIQELTEYAYHKISALDKVSLLSNPRKKTGILSFNIEEIHPHDIASFLNKDEIAVRAGMHCTQPLLESMGKPATVRASFSIYNTKEEIDRLADSVEELIKFWS
jgi:cysteine desulfurase/selenocysteine lyase